MNPCSTPRHEHTRGSWIAFGQVAVPAILRQAHICPLADRVSRMMFRRDLPLRRRRAREPPLFLITLRYFSFSTQHGRLVNTSGVGKPSDDPPISCSLCRLHRLGVVPSHVVDSDGAIWNKHFPHERGAMPLRRDDQQMARELPCCYRLIRRHDPEIIPSSFLVHGR